MTQRLQLIPNYVHPVILHELCFQAIKYIGIPFILCYLFMNLFHTRYRLKYTFLLFALFQLSYFYSFLPSSVAPSSQADASVWQLAHDVWSNTRSGGCSVQLGHVGDFYYKYYPVIPSCSTKISDRLIKTAAGYIYDAAGKGEAYPKAFSLTYQTYRDGIKGILVLGTDISTWCITPPAARYLGYLTD